MTIAVVLLTFGFTYYLYFIAPMQAETERSNGTQDFFSKS